MLFGASHGTLRIRKMKNTRIKKDSIKMPAKIKQHSRINFLTFVNQFSDCLVLGHFSEFLVLSEVPTRTRRPLEFEKNGPRMVLVIISPICQSVSVLVISVHFGQSQSVYEFSITGRPFESKNLN